MTINQTALDAAIATLPRPANARERAGLEKLIGAYVAALPPSHNIALPEGWRMVPNKPDAEMKAAAMQVLLHSGNIYTNEGEETVVVETYTVQAVWDAMLGRVPAPEPEKIKGPDNSNPIVAWLCFDKVNGTWAKPIPAGELADYRRGRPQAWDMIPLERFAPRPIAHVSEYRKADGTKDYYATLRCGDRDMTLFRHAVRGRAEYEVAELNWLISGGEKPSIGDFDCDAPEREKPAPQEVPPVVDATEVRNKALDDAAWAAQRLLENWSGDLYATFESYVVARRTGTHNGRKIPESMARTFAHDFKERSEAVSDCVEHVVNAIRKLKKAEPGAEPVDAQLEDATP